MIHKVKEFFNFQSKGQSRLLVSYATNKGKVRESNEDDYFVDSVGIKLAENENGLKIVSALKPTVFSVFDGMGGESFGGEASQVCAKVFLEMSKLFADSQSAYEINERLSKTIKRANELIVDMRMQRRCGVIGSTMAAVCVYGNKTLIYSIGDSKVFTFFNGDLKQITEDQTVATWKVKCNFYTEEEGRSSEDHSKLTSFVGIDDRNIGLKAQHYEVPNIDGTTILLCTDGLTDMCTSHEIEEVLRSGSQQKAELLVKKALQNGGKDNVTCIVIEGIH